MFLNEDKDPAWKLDLDVDLLTIFNNEIDNKSDDESEHYNKILGSSIENSIYD